MDVDKQRVAELVLEIQNGNKNAFNELYKLTSSRAYFVALQITKNEEDAQDILQDCYIKALEKIDSLDKPESFVSWFHQMVANKSKDYLKKKKPTLFEGGEDEAFEVIPDEDESFVPESSLDKTELQSAIMEAVNELSDDKRTCVLMMYFEEMSVNEIAQTLEVPVSTVKNRLFTARKDLKNSFAKRGITSLYSAAPIGAVIWALRGLSDAVSETFAGSAASTQILSGVTAASAGTAAAGAGSAAAAGTGIAAKAAAFSVAQKVVAGIAVAGVVTGSAVGVTTVVKNNRETETTTQVYTEQVTTAPEEAKTAMVIISETETTLVVSLSSSATSTSAPTTKKEPTATSKTSTTVNQTTAVKTTKPSTTKKETTLPSTTVTTSATTKPTTVTSTTEKTTVITTKATTKPTTKKTTTTTKATTSATTTKAATSAKTTEPPSTTEAATTTTTKKQTATVKIKVIDYDENLVTEINVEVDPGTELTWDYLMELVRSKGYEARSGVFGDVGVTAEAGGIYNVRAEL